MLQLIAEKEPVVVYAQEYITISGTIIENTIIDPKVIQLQHIWPGQILVPYMGIATSQLGPPTGRSCIRRSAERI